MDDQRKARLRAEAMKRLAQEGASTEELRIMHAELLLQFEELQDAQIRLEASRHRYQQRYEYAPVGFIEIDARGILKEANQKAKEMLDLPPVDGPPPPVALARLVREEDHPILVRHLNALFKEQMAVSHVLKLKHRDRIVHLHSRHFGLRGAEPVGLTTLVDITAERELERARGEVLRRKAEEIARAEAIQRDLISPTIPVLPGLSLSAFLEPSEELGGDFLVLEPTADGVLLIAADCMGHGIEASLFAAFLRALIDQHLELLHRGELRAFMTAVNRGVCRSFKRRNYPVMLSAVVNMAKRTLTWSNANFPRPVLIRRGVATRLDPIRGFFLGYEEDAEFTESVVPLEDGDSLFLASDALQEIQTPEGPAISDRDLLPYLAGLDGGPERNLGRLVGRIAALKPFPLEDDTTLLFCEIRSPMERSWDLTGSGDFAAVAQVLRGFMDRFGYRREEQEAVAVALGEFLGNAWSHGNQERPGSRIRMKARIATDEVSFSVEDEGLGFDPATVEDPSDPVRQQALMEHGNLAMLRRGRGLWLCRKLLTEVRHEAGGRTAVGVLRRAPPVVNHWQPPKAYADGPRSEVSGQFDFQDRSAISSLEIRGILEAVREGLSVSVRALHPTLRKTLEKELGFGRLGVVFLN